MQLKIPDSVKEKSNRILTNSNINLNDDVEVNLNTCLEMKHLTHVLKKLRDLTDDKLETILNDSELPNLQFRLKQCRYATLNEIFPTWNFRDSLLSQCKKELDNYKKELDLTHSAKLAKDNFESYDSNNNLDPYRKRDFIKKTTADYTRFNAASRWLDQQTGVEKIVKERSINLLKNKCADNIEYMRAFELFRRDKFGGSR
ncbi:hypothetical protein QEN19_003509 [Hanseniaspora menglaensis]